MAWGICSGGDIDEDNADGYHYCIFTTAGAATLTISTAGDFEVLAVGSGGSNRNISQVVGYGGSGGAGVQFSTLALSGPTHAVTVAGTPAAAANGTASTISSLTANGGAAIAIAGTVTGGSAGAPLAGSSSVYSGLAAGAQGNASGNSRGSGSGGFRAGGGGGGAGGAGVSAVISSTTYRPDGGVGVEVPEFAAYLGSPAGWFGGGGGGGAQASFANGPGLAQNGGGGNGTLGAGADGNHGAANTGGGAGGGYNNLGGSGVVAVRYKLPLTEVAAAVSGSATLVTAVDVIDPLTNIVASLAGGATLSTDLNLRYYRRSKSRRQFVYVRGLDGTMKGVLS